MVEVCFVLPSIPRILRVFWCCEYSQHEQYQRTSSVCGTVPAVQNPQMLGKTGSIHSIEPRNAASPEVSAGQNLEILRVLAASAVNNPRKFCEYTNYLQYFLSRMLYFTPRCREQMRNPSLVQKIGCGKRLRTVACLRTVAYVRTIRRQSARAE